MKSTAKYGIALLFAALCAAPLQARPRLVVLVVVDQMRADYLDRFRGEFIEGFARLSREGAVFTRARFHQAPTETAPGHATLATGRPPAEHGIVGNVWRERETGRIVRAVDDAVYGRSPFHLLGGTVGDALKARDPASKVVSLAGKDRSAILLGGKRPDAALWYDRDSGNFETSAYYGAAPGWIEAYNRRREADRRFRALYPDASTIVPTPFYYELTLTSFLDEMTARAALAGLRALKLGADVHPDLLFVGFSALDTIGHRFGSESPEIRTQVLELDRILGDFFKELDRRVGRKNYVVVLTADHGIMTRPESPAGRDRGGVRILADEFNRRLEIALEKRFPLPVDSKEGWLTWFSPPHLHLNERRAAAAGIPWPRFLAGAVEVLRGFPEIAEVYVPSSGAPALSGDGLFERSHYAPRSGDILVRFKDDRMFTHDATDSHGSAQEEDAAVPLIVWGKGVRGGRYADPVDAAEVAPALGRMLGIDFPGRAGALADVLEGEE